MSATSGGYRTGDTDDVVGTARSHATVPRSSWVHEIVDTKDDIAPSIGRLTLGLILLPHAAQKAFGWFEGFGLSGTYAFYTQMLHIPGWLAGAAILAEILAALMLIVGAFTRVAAGAVILVMLGAIAFVHWPNGFFMNWSGAQPGEGFEFHLLVIGLSIVLLGVGGGRWSVDRVLMNLRPAEGGSVVAPVTRD